MRLVKPCSIVSMDTIEQLIDSEFGDLFVAIASKRYPDFISLNNVDELELISLVVTSSCTLLECYLRRIH